MAVMGYVYHAFEVRINERLNEGWGLGSFCRRFETCLTAPRTERLRYIQRKIEIMDYSNTWGVEYIDEAKCKVWILRHVRFGMQCARQTGERPARPFASCAGLVSMSWRWC